MRSWTRPSPKPHPQMARLQGIPKVTLDTDPLVLFTTTPAQSWRKSWLVHISHIEDEIIFFSRHKGNGGIKRVLWVQARNARCICVQVVVMLQWLHVILTEFGLFPGYLYLGGCRNRNWVSIVEVDLSIQYLCSVKVFSEVISLLSPLEGEMVQSYHVCQSICGSVVAYIENMQVESTVLYLWNFQRRFLEVYFSV